MTSATKVADPRDIDGILVQGMIKPHTEVILGCTRDSSFGHAVLVGLGGIFVEVLKDFSLRLPPIREAEARRMVAELRSGRILAGYRGRGPADVEALVSAIVSFSRLLEDVGDMVREADINPLFVLDEGRGTVVGDALFVLDGGEL
jgi:acyl-CoA synthetase (NDP forming)